MTKLSVKKHFFKAKTADQTGEKRIERSLLVIKSRAIAQCCVTCERVLYKASLIDL